METDLAHLADLSLNYSEVGATGHSLPTDARHLARRVTIGRGPDVFARAADALMTWRMHTGAGLSVRATAARAAVGVNVLIGVGPAWAQLRVPCRVLHVIDQPDRVGFTYGTLHGHPVAGEESFSVLLADDQVSFVVIGFTRPTRSATGLALRASGPIGRAVNDRILDRYGTALQRAGRGD